jgi:hypothetical protein
MALLAVEEYLPHRWSILYASKENRAAGKI